MHLNNMTIYILSHKWLERKLFCTTTAKKRQFLFLLFNSFTAMGFESSSHESKSSNVRTFRPFPFFVVNSHPVAIRARVCTRSEKYPSPAVYYTHQSVVYLISWQFNAESLLLHHVFHEKIYISQAAANYLNYAHRSRNDVLLRKLLADRQHGLW